MATEDAYQELFPLDRLAEDSPELVQVGGRSIALFHHEGRVYAVDNRCPHMGFPLSKGTVDDGLLTCHWHHARFELACGDTLDPWADDVQTFPVEVRDGTVYLDPDPEPDVPRATHWRNRLADSMRENIDLVAAKAIINLDDLGEGFATPLETAVDFGITYRAMGWGRGLTTLGAMANLYDDVAHAEKLRAMYVGVTEVADDSAGEPPRFDQYELRNGDLSKARLKSWFRDTCEVRDSDGAERCLRTAAAHLPPEDVVEVLLAAATDHLYMNASHTLDFVNKAVETLDHVGWAKAEDVLAATVEQFTDASRSEELSQWRQPIDVADLCFDAHDALPDLVAAGEGREWERPDDLVETLLSDDPRVVAEALEDAIREGATAERLARTVALAATRRVAHFATSNEFSDWNTVHHTFSYANAAHALAARTDAIEAYRPCFDAAMSVYLDRFLNTPAAPIPEPGESARDPETIRKDLLATFDEQGRVNEAGALVSEHFDAGGGVAALKHTLAEGLLREDAGFHELQNVEAAFRQAEFAEDDAERRLPLIATARYLAAHFPTRREREQTFTIAHRLFRGEAIHGEDA
ncbi:Rieske (2Fe-2S) protein [Haloarcula nitratireducens]|uniref:Rieske 2Fe-2S domain-containing protein n=1 Tax=Haloarcula nitratireducens TaxID=2487749 RepID=A0AAW4P7G2_9EURY|nr:Rieske 2Fe-2S domain-containing protein [Halomicroarcula nitratireducens]MBX0293673.1 Rieske 2Fe-2S domain-containing protein [Halomicroarcula nitratireducens]